ncbi:MAG: CDP-diacylglycerol--glycerol-3-phosphate 3-phosphatidyltransferase [Oscillospiraceae bacterium]|jgi:CDP-diacylglycerol--glycerol-3-phosphate 3-phosphatidyltransferase|nr:CDP-diacylglycerol--glycerol-3-phosphate 3-phosphatidyltransferase [Oscillospiraceae bacterium]
MNFPNKLTIARMILAPIFLLSMYLPLADKYLVAFLLFIAAAVTDAMDGNIARKRNQVTVFGKLTDPVADKMLTTAAYLAFLDFHWVGAWIVMIILVREFAVTSVRLVAAAQGVVIPANIWGKIKTVSQCIVIPTILFLFWLNGRFAFGDEKQIVMLSNILLGVTAVLAIYSGVIYVFEGAKRIEINMK